LEVRHLPEDLQEETDGIRNPMETNPEDVLMTVCTVLMSAILVTRETVIPHRLVDLLSVVSAEEARFLLVAVRVQFVVQKNVNDLGKDPEAQEERQLVIEKSHPHVAVPELFLVIIAKLSSH